MQHPGPKTKKRHYAIVSFLGGTHATFAKSTYASFFGMTLSSATNCDRLIGRGMPKPTGGLDAVRTVSEPYCLHAATQRPAKKGGQGIYLHAQTLAEVQNNTAAA